VIRVVVAGRSSVVRAGLESVVRSSSSLQLAGSIDWALVNSAEFEADVLLIEAGGALPERVPELAVVLIDTSLVNAALQAGIRGVLSREASPEEIESAVQAVYAGLVVLPAGSLPEILGDARPPAAALAGPLSEREIEVLNLIAEGQSNKLIAIALGISEHTVKTHVASILAKLGAASRTEAVSQAIRRGLVML